MENNSYNILIKYRGDGDFKFMVKRIGEVYISKTKPVYIYNATVEVINDLRSLKRLLIDVIIGAKPTGAYKIYDYNDYTDMPRAVVGQRPNIASAEPISNSEISSILKGGSAAPVIENTEDVKDEVTNTDEDKAPETKKEEVKKTAPKKKSSKKK